MVGGRGPRGQRPAVDRRRPRGAGRGQGRPAVEDLMGDAGPRRRARLRADRADARRAARPPGRRASSSPACYDVVADGGRAGGAELGVAGPDQRTSVAGERRRRRRHLHDAPTPTSSSITPRPRPAWRSSARSRSRSTSPTVDAALAAVDAAGVLLHVGFNRRFDPAHRAVQRGRRRAASSATLHLVRITSRDPAPPPIGYIAAVRRAVPRHDDPRLRHGPLRHGQRGRRGVRRRRVRVDPAIGEVGDIDTAVVTLRHATAA